MVRACAPKHLSVLYPTPCSIRLYLNIFRGEPAISGFDWNFTANHKSSPSFATLVGSGLPTRFLEGSPCSWLDHSGFGSTPRPYDALLRLAFATRPGQRPLHLGRRCNSLAHSSKGTPSPLRAPTPCKHIVSGTISLPYSGYFSPFPHGTCSLSVRYGI